MANRAALAPLAVTAEEKEFARDAERLADHDVDQAFASALRQATLQAQHITLTGDALALSQKIAQLQQLIKQDQAQVEQHYAAVELALEPGEERCAASGGQRRSGCGQGAARTGHG